MDTIYDTTFFYIAALPLVLLVEKLAWVTSLKRANAYEQRRKAILDLILTNDHARAYLYFKCIRHSIRAVLCYVLVFLFAFFHSLELPDSILASANGIPQQLIKVALNITACVGCVSLLRSWKANGLIKEAFLRRDPNQMIDESAKAHFDSI